MRLKYGLTLIVVAAIAASGCGYSLAGRGSFLPTDIRVVGIPLLENRTNRARIEQVMTDKIRNEFINRTSGKYEIRPTTTGADAVLSGTIMGVDYQAIGLTGQQQQASRYLFTVTMRVLFTDTRNGQVLWSNAALTFREEYDLKARGNDGVVLLEEEGPAVQRLSEDLARSVVTAILEAF